MKKLYNFINIPNEMINFEIFLFIIIAFLILWSCQIPLDFKKMCSNYYLRIQYLFFSNPLYTYTILLPFQFSLHQMMITEPHIGGSYIGSCHTDILLAMVDHKQAFIVENIMNNKKPVLELAEQSHNLAIPLIPLTFENYPGAMLYKEHISRLYSHLIQNEPIFHRRVFQFKMFSFLTEYDNRKFSGKPMYTSVQDTYQKYPCLFKKQYINSLPEAIRDYKAIKTQFNLCDAWKNIEENGCVPFGEKFQNYYYSIKKQEKELYNLKNLISLLNQEKRYNFPWVKSPLRFYEMVIYNNKLPLHPLNMSNMYYESLNKNEYNHFYARNAQKMYLGR